jgi:hypothetical protein
VERITDEQEPAETEKHQSPKTLDAWLMLKQAELMLGHLESAPVTWPQNALYLHACITALRSITLVLQKALAHEPRFPEWYAEVEGRLREDPEVRYLKEARNYVLKEGALQLLGSYEVRGTSWLPGMVLKGIGPEGPELWAPDPDDPDKEIPVDWRRLPDFKFITHLRLAELPDLPAPPEKELKASLAEKIVLFESILRSADERFDPEGWDEEPP